jgi:hypothetical protein
LAGRSLASTGQPQAMLSSMATEVASLSRHADRQLAARQHGGHAGVVQPAMELHAGLQAQLVDLRAQRGLRRAAAQQVQAQRRPGAALQQPGQRAGSASMR